MKNSSKLRTRKRQGEYLVNPIQGMVIGSLCILVAMAAGWTGYEIGQRDLDVPHSELIGSLQSLFDAERRSLHSEKRETGEHLDALARKMGQMQAELLRLEAMGERLVEMGGLDNGEFDFMEIPALGGPESPNDVSASLPEMIADLDVLAQRIEDREIKLAMLEDLLLSREITENSKPAGRPVAAGWISSHYGWRKDPFNGKKNMHRGIDFVGKPGTDIIAMADGLVSWAGNRSGYGKTVEIRHGNGYVTRYAHNSKLLVSEGELVRQGQVIAAMGRSGRATGTHLHFEVIRGGKTVNPLKFVKAVGTEKTDS